MNDRELRRHLESLAAPAVNETERNRALHRAMIAFAMPSGMRDTTEVRPGWRTSDGWVAAFVVMLVMGLVMIRPFQPAPGVNGGADLRMLSQVEGLFPGQLNAVIERDGEMQLDLARQSSPASSEQPVIVQFERGGQRLRVLSYSGRSITLELKGGPVTFEALVTSDGGVVLSGPDFVWSSAQPASLAGYRVNAQPLGTTL